MFNMSFCNNWCKALLFGIVNASINLNYNVEIYTYQYCILPTTIICPFAEQRNGQIAFY
jgi:hypothetical protein